MFWRKKRDLERVTEAVRAIESMVSITESVRGVAEYKSPIADFWPRHRVRKVPRFDDQLRPKGHYWLVEIQEMQDAKWEPVRRRHSEGGVAHYLMTPEERRRYDWECNFVAHCFDSEQAALAFIKHSRDEEVSEVSFAPAPEKTISNATMTVQEFLGPETFNEIVEKLEQFNEDLPCNTRRPLTTDECERALPREQRLLASGATESHSGLRVNKGYGKRRK